jgi:hypothetical protein
MRRSSPGSNPIRLFLLSDSLFPNPVCGVQIGNVFSPLSSVQLMTLPARVRKRQYRRHLRAVAAGHPDARLPPTVGLAHSKFQLRATRGCERE